jgi:sodium:dicarboxylate symporter family protein
MFRGFGSSAYHAIDLRLTPRAAMAHEKPAERHTRRLTRGRPGVQPSGCKSNAKVVRHKPLYAYLYVQVLTAILVDIALGFLFPDLAIWMRPLGDGFIKLIRMIIAPIIFTTVVAGIAKMGDMKEVGRVGLKALIYFEAVTTTLA